jgi:hypothetical protein
MIRDEVIENYLNCKYKAYRKLNNEQGTKKEFEVFQREQVSEWKTKFYDSLLEEHSEDKLFHGFKFGINSRVSKVNVLIQPTLETEAFQISFDAIEIAPNKNSKKLQIPIIVSSIICLKDSMIYSQYFKNFYSG